MRIAVVGAGILGASVAYHLAAAGAKVVLVDDAAQGRATAAGAGIICPWPSLMEDPVYRLASAGARYYPELISRLAESGQADISYRKIGALTAPGDAELDQVERRMRDRAATAPEVGVITRLTPREARALFPPLNEDRAAVHIEGAARVDGAALARAMSRAAAARDAKLMRGRARLAHANDRVTGVVVDGETVDADAVVVTAGVWANDILAPLGLRIAIEPQRGQIIHLRLPGVNTRTWPVLLPLNGYYLLAFDDSRVVIGATREDGSGMDYRVTAGGQAEVLNAGLAVAPGLSSATMIETRVGFRPMSPDGKPQLGRVAGWDGLMIGNGMGHSGLTIGPYAGKLLAQLALDETPSVDLSAYEPAVRASGPCSGELSDRAHR
jgi:D-amino-acid dehydrogenase